MTITKEQLKELETLSEPLIKWLNDNSHPHTKIIIECDGVEFVEGICYTPIHKFIKD